MDRDFEKPYWNRCPIFWTLCNNRTVFQIFRVKYTHKKVLIISTLTEQDIVGKKELHQVKSYAIRFLCAKNHFNWPSHHFSCNKGFWMGLIRLYLGTKYEVCRWNSIRDMAHFLDFGQFLDIWPWPVTLTFWPRSSALRSLNAPYWVVSWYQVWSLWFWDMNPGLMIRYFTENANRN